MTNDQRPTTNDQRPTPLLSVIITSYNELKYLPKAIESVLSQSFQDIEIIIGDDGSNDGSIELIERYCNEYPGKIKYFVMERNVDEKNFIPVMRHSQVFKTAFKKARGKYFLCLDGDDYFCDDEKFYDAVSFLESHKNYVGYMSGYKWAYPDGRKICYYSDNYPRSVFWSGMYIPVSSCVFSRRVYDDGYILNQLCSDTAITFAILSAGKVYFTDKITYAYRQREESMSHTSNELELKVLELMLFQECLCSGRMKWSSCSRYYFFLNFVYVNRRELHKSLYSKYLNICEKYDNNVLGAILNYDTDIKSRCFIFWLRLKCRIAKSFFIRAERFYRFQLRIIRKCKRILFRN